MNQRLTLTVLALLISFASFGIGAITGASSVCTGSSTVLSDTSAGGIWSSSNTGIATIGSSSGIVSGVSPGTATIIYYIGGVGYVTMPVTVNTMPSLSGGSVLCSGSSIALTATPSGGAWFPGNSAVATVTVTAGVVYGVGAGTDTIYYNHSGCYAKQALTVNAAASVTGSSSLCTGAATTLTASIAGGTWTTGNSAVATVTSGGVVTGAGAGEANIYYLEGGCYAYHTVTVHVTPVVTGSNTVCTGSTTTLIPSLPGGSWSSSNTGIATVNSGGIVTGVASGIVNIYYYLNGCYGYRPLTVNPTPVITGDSTACTGTTITLTATPSGGTWTTSNATVATVTPYGVVTGGAAGAANIYNNLNGCYAFHYCNVLCIAGDIWRQFHLLGSDTDVVGVSGRRHLVEQQHWYCHREYNRSRERYR